MWSKVRIHVFNTWIIRIALLKWLCNGNKASILLIMECRAQHCKRKIVWCEADTSIVSDETLGCQAKRVILIRQIKFYIHVKSKEKCNLYQDIFKYLLHFTFKIFILDLYSN